MAFPAPWTSHRPLWRYLGSAVGIALVALLSRIYIYQSVFRKDDVVLLANDPYWFRYLVDRATTATDGFVEITTLLQVIDQLHGRNPTMILSLSWAAELGGGSLHAVGTVLAWYPVVMGLLSVALVYGIAYRVTTDHWIAAMAAVLLAITPVHVFRTALGFADHHAGDYLWLAATTFCLVWLADTDGSSTLGRWLAAGALGLSIAGQVFWWIAGPLLIVPIGGYVAVRALSDVRAGSSPARANGPVVAGVGVAIVVAWLGRPLLHQLPFDLQRGVYILSLVLLLGGILAVLLLAEFVYRTDLPVGLLGAAELISLCICGWILISTVTNQTNLTRATRSLLGVLLPGSTIAESVSLFGGPLGLLTGPFSLFGISLFIGIPYLGVATWAIVREHRPAWIVLVIYGWYFLTLATLQRRFAGELSLFVAVFVAIGLLDIAGRAGVLRTVPLFELPRLTSGEIWSLRSGSEQVPPGVYPLMAVVFLIVTASFVQIPIKMNQVTIDGDEHDTAIAMGQAAVDTGLSDQENYVLSPWGRSRMYNYFVSGKVFTGTSGTGHGKPLYWAARYYYPFLAATDGEAWYTFLTDNRTGFVVTRDGQGSFPDEALYTRLHQQYGSRRGAVPGVAHYRAVYASPDGSPKGFMLVSGATIVGTGPPNATIALSTEVNVPGASFTYRRTTRTNATGRYRVTVPYSGRYAVGNATVTVSEPDVLDGRTVRTSRSASLTRALPEDPKNRATGRHDMNSYSRVRLESLPEASSIPVPTRKRSRADVDVDRGYSPTDPPGTTGTLGGGFGPRTADGWTRSAGASCCG